MKSVNKREIVYVGRQGAANFVIGRRRVAFTNRVPRMVSEDEAKILLRSSDFVPMEEFVKTMEERCSPGLITIKRWGALGDLLQLRAAISAIARLNPAYTFALDCQDHFAGVFAHDPLWRPLPKVPGTVFSLEQVAEVDHRGTEIHRLELFWKAMTTRAIDIRPSDWDLKVGKEAVDYVDEFFRRSGLGVSSRPLIALQVRGSGKMKSLPDQQIRQLAAALSTHADVFLVEYDAGRCWKNPGVFSMPGRDALHGIEVLRRCDLCVCFDSGCLWMAHVASVPTLCIMGPTRPEQRLIYHPLYDVTRPIDQQERVRHIKLNDLVVLDGRTGCPPCFERAEKCKGTYACIQKQPDGIVRKIADAAIDMINSLGAQLPYPAS